VADSFDKAGEPRGRAGWGTLVFRLLVTSGWTAFLVVVWLVGQVLLGRARREVLRAWTMRAWGRCNLWATNVHVTVEGTPPRAPRSSGLLVTNHVSYVDIMLLASVVGLSFVSMAELRGWPVLGFLSRLAGTVFIDRSRKRELVAVNERIEQVLAEGRLLVAFAEGANSSGEEVQPFRPSLLEPAARGGLPVHYAALTYRTHNSDRPASERVAWFGGAPFLPHFLRLIRGYPVHAVVRFGPAPLRSRDRKALARELHGAVRGLFTPLE
jgi:1-acyl-sn-glycerol-3-phosphate acyltransferase